MIISIVAAMDRNRGIGIHNTLPWPRLHKDAKHFQEITTGKPVIMGRKTFDSVLVALGRPLPNRVSIVITRELGGKENTQDVIWVRSLQEAIEEATIQATKLNVEEICVVGGGQVYKEALPLCDRLYLTLVNADFECDTFFPEYSGFSNKVSEEMIEDAGYQLQFITLERSE